MFQTETRVVADEPGGSSKYIHGSLLSASASLESLSEVCRNGSRCGSYRTGSRILLCLIATPSSGSCSADTYTILSLWSQQR